jgi:cardiolipin synthase A/B
MKVLSHSSLLNAIRVLKFPDTPDDELWVSVGSTNFDSRSFKLNDESNLNVYNKEFAERQLADFKVDLERTRQITFQEWESRPWMEKTWEHSLKIIRPQL